VSFLNLDSRIRVNQKRWWLREQVSDLIEA